MKSKESSVIVFAVTPGGTSIQMIDNTNQKELSDNEITARDKYVSQNYPRAEQHMKASNKYNAHSYAWYSQDASNRCWMEVPWNDDGQGYMNDGSYIPREENEKPQRDDKIFYRRSDGFHHSGIVLEDGRIISKWDDLGLYVHGATECPYYKDGVNIEYYYSKR
jgi:hypothetical protein